MKSKFLQLLLLILLTMPFCKLFAQSDEPCTATELIVTGNSCTNPVAGCINPPVYTNSTSASAGVTLPTITCNGFGATTLDYWFKATVPASGKLSINVSSSGTGSQVTTFWDMAVFTSSNPTTCTGSTFTQIASECATGTLPNLTITQPAGTVVYISMWREAASAQTANRCFSICAIDPPQPPANDSVCNAIDLLIDGPADCKNTTGATSYVGVDPLAVCSTPNNTVWYKYTPTTSGKVIVKLKRPTGITSGLLNAWVVFFRATGTCPALTFTRDSCYQGNLVAADSAIIITDNLVAGTQYWIMIDGVSGSFGQFCINLQSIPPPPATCATSIAPSSGAVNVNSPIVTMNWTAISGASEYIFYFGINNPPDSLGLTATNTIFLSNVLPSTKYYWKAVPRNAGGVPLGCLADSFTTAVAPPPPPNDNCPGAISIGAYASVQGTTVSATQSQPAESCAGFTGIADDDVWYKFTTSQAGDVTITLTPKQSFDGIIQAYSGVCGSLVNIGCADANGGGLPETLALLGLSAGTTYYIRVYTYDSSGNTGNFTLNASGAALPVNISTFHGERNGSVNVLSWTTFTEEKNKGFELQKSFDGKYFSTLDFIVSKSPSGNSTSRIDYRFIDEKSLIGTTYYRLKQVDFDGKSKLSNVISIKGAKTETLSISAIYPNPVKNFLNISVDAPQKEKVFFVITDLIGKVVLQKSIQLNIFSK